MRLLWPLAASLVLSGAASATATPRQDSVTVTVATRTGTRLGAVRMPRSVSMVLTTWRALPVWGTSPSASVIGLTSAEWSAADLGEATTVEVRLAIDTLTAGNRILVRTGTFVRSIFLAMPTSEAPPAPKAVNAPGATTRALPAPPPERHDSLPTWVRAARESFNTPTRLRPPTTPATPAPVAPAPAEAPPTQAPRSPIVATERIEQPSRGLTAGRPSEPDVAPAPSRTERYDLGDLVRPAGSATRRMPASAPEDASDDATPSDRSPGPKQASRQLPMEATDASRPQALLRVSYLDAPQYLVLAVERPLTRALSASLESSRALGTTQPAVAPGSILSLGARWYLIAQRRTPYLFGDVGVAWTDSTKLARHGAGLGVLWPVGGLVDLDVAVRAWGQLGLVTEPARWTAGVRVHFKREE